MQASEQLDVLRTCRASREQHVGETARALPGVEADAAGHVDPGARQRGVELEPAARRPAQLGIVDDAHGRGVVEFLADRVAVMQGGRIVEQGASAEVLERPAHEYTRQLLAAVPRLTIEA